MMVIAFVYDNLTLSLKYSSGCRQARLFANQNDYDLPTLGDYVEGQWRRQLWSTGARVPLDFQQFHF